MNKQKLILPISIILGCIILGVFFYVSQINKQNSIERQQELKLQEIRRQNEEIEKQENIEIESNTISIVCVRSTLFIY